MYIQIDIYTHVYVNMYICIYIYSKYIYISIYKYVDIYIPIYITKKMIRIYTVAQKSGYSSFGRIFIPYAIALIVCFFISLFYGPIFMLLPGFIVFVFAFRVREHIVR
jgi:hypothetical protein